MGVPKTALLEYVLNQHDLWDDAWLASNPEADNDDDETEDSFEKYLGDLDVALLSLIEPLDTEVEQLATILDEAQAFVQDGVVFRWVCVTCRRSVGNHRLSAGFTEMEGLRGWLRENDALLNDPEFWQSEDHQLLWAEVSAPTAADYPRPWNHKNYTVSPDWKGATPPASGTRVRIIAGGGRTATITASDLMPLAPVQLPFDHAVPPSTGE